MTTVQRPASAACRRLLAATEPLDRVGLGALNRAAALMTRMDQKYLLPPALLPRFVRALDDRVADDTGAGLAVLAVDGLSDAAGRASHYESVYFDTDDLALYRAHLQDRRLRYKVRTRTYVDSGLCLLEVKLKGARGATVKERTAHPYEDRDVFSERAHDYLSGLLRQAYGLEPPPLRAQLTTTYRRTTLVDVVGGTRVTCDVDLICSGGGRSRAADGCVVVESKSADGRAPADAVLRELGVRPVRISKYCTGVALLHPQLPVNPWSRTLTEHYGHRRAA